MMKMRINRACFLSIPLISSLCHKTVAFGWKHNVSTLAQTNNKIWAGVNVRVENERQT